MVVPNGQGGSFFIPSVCFFVTHYFRTAWVHEILTWPRKFREMLWLLLNFPLICVSRWFSWAPKTKHQASLCIKPWSHHVGTTLCIVKTICSKHHQFYWANTLKHSHPICVSDWWITCILSICTFKKFFLFCIYIQQRTCAFKSVCILQLAKQVWRRYPLIETKRNEC